MAEGTAPVLNGPNFDEMLILQTDESSEGLGGVFNQLDPNSQEHPVA